MIAKQPLLPVGAQTSDGTVPVIQGVPIGGAASSKIDAVPLIDQQTAATLGNA